MDPQPGDPHEDLFAAQPAKPTPAVVSPPAVVERPPAAVERPAAAEPTRRPLSDNPLWEIPLGGLTASRARPLFAPTRRPPAPAPVATPAPQPVAAPPKPVEPATPPLALLGTIVGSEQLGLFVDSATKAVVRLKAGDNHKGWTLRAVRRHQVELARGLDSAVLDIPPPDTKQGGAPAAAPPPAPTPGAPARPVPAGKLGSPSPAGKPGSPAPAGRGGGPQNGPPVAAGARPAALKP